MPTVPLGENPYLYQDGPTVPLRQQKTGTYAANTFGNRVFYTPGGALPNTTLAPGLPPTAGQIARQNLSGAGAAGAVVGGALTAVSGLNNGAGLFESFGAGLGVVAGATGGQIAGTIGGIKAGGAVGSAVPVVGTASGAAVGGAAGGVAGGLVGGSVGGNIGGGLGRAVDRFFWPSPAEPAIGIPGQPSAATPREGRGVGTPAGALGAGPVDVPGEPIYGPPPYTGGQMPGVLYRAIGTVTAERVFCDTSQIAPFVFNYATEFRLLGPISGVQLTQNTPGQCGPRGITITANTGDGPTTIYSTLDVNSRAFRNPSFTVNFERQGGLPDTGGDPQGPLEGEIPPDRLPNPARVPYRPFGTDGFGVSPRSVPANPDGFTSPWPERRATPVPGVDPFGDDSPFAAPETAPNFDPSPSPTTTPDPATSPAPSRTTDPLNPGPGGPLPTADPARRATPTFIPIPVFPGGVNPPDVQVPQVPVSVPAGFRQPATTPTGSPQQLINPTTAPTTNPNVQPALAPIPQPARIEQGNCCTPPPDQELIRRLEEIKKGIGFQGLPCSVPDQIAKPAPNQIQVGSLAELHLWQVQQLDGLMGRWPVGIPIPTGTGTTTVGMPNMAEAVAEMIGMMVSQQVTATQILNTCSRALVQAGSATQQAHLAHLVAKANAEFLGYESRPTEVEMPLAFAPGKDPFDGLLEESQQKIKGFENTDSQDIKAIFAELLQAAAIIRAVYWRKLDPRGDLRKQLRDQLRGQSDFIDQAAAGNGDDSDWEAYLRAVEQGFRESTGDDTPYNRRPEEGPQIRDRSPGNDNQR